MLVDGGHQDVSGDEQEQQPGGAAVPKVAEMGRRVFGAAVTTSGGVADEGDGRHGEHEEVKCEMPQAGGKADGARALLGGDCPQDAGEDEYEEQGAEGFVHGDEGFCVAEEAPGKCEEVHAGDGNGHAPVQGTADGAVVAGGVGGSFVFLGFVVVHDFCCLCFQFGEEGAFADAEGFEFFLDGIFSVRFDEDFLSV